MALKTPPWRPPPTLAASLAFRGLPQGARFIPRLGEALGGPLALLHMDGAEAVAGTDDDELWPRGQEVKHLFADPLTVGRSGMAEQVSGTRPSKLAVGLPAWDCWFGSDLPGGRHGLAHAEPTRCRSRHPKGPGRSRPRPGDLDRHRRSGGCGPTPSRTATCGALSPHIRASFPCTSTPMSNSHLRIGNGLAEKHPHVAAVSKTGSSGAVG